MSSGPKQAKTAVRVKPAVHVKPAVQTKPLQQATASQQPTTSQHTKSSRYKSAGNDFHAKSSRGSQPWLVTATDICLWLTMLFVATGFGGRMGGGQLALVLGASITACCWILSQWTSSESRYSWTGSEWLWLAGILVGVCQIVPLPTTWLLYFSPQIQSILPLWFEPDTAKAFAGGWHQLSLAPWETTSGLATFTAYGLLFAVACQRTRTLGDIEQTLCLVALASIGMMVFAQLQFLAGNGKFFWTYDHPFMTTDTYPLGCFTNRNHLAQFLALGMAPVIWWLLRRFQQQQQDQVSQSGLPQGMHLFAVAFLLASLAGLALTVLMTLSRGGLVAMSLTTLFALGLMCRIGIASTKVSLGLVLVTVGTGLFFSSSKYESILTGRLEQNSGRSEIWRANFEVARDFPWLGTGIGTHSDAYQLRIAPHGDDGLEYSHAECGYLQVASETGIAGLIICALMIGTSFWWCISAMRNSDRAASSAAATILSGLIANVAHAAGDFFWYTPSVMLLLAVQLACAARLHRMARQSAGIKLTSFRLPRLVTSLSLCGVGLLGAWMYQLKNPAARAEPHHMEAIRLAKLDVKDLSEEEQEEVQSQRLNEAILAAKANPHDAKLQESACFAYLQLFDLRQQHAENTMSAGMLRDAVKASEFKTTKAAMQWLDGAIGTNLKLLKLARRAVQRSLMNSPLRSKSYIQLADLNFLSRKDNPEWTQRCLTQALRLRPVDPDMMYLVGLSELQEGRIETALNYWRPAFEQSLRMRERIAGFLAAQMTLEYFQTEFHPDWKGLEVIGHAFTKAGREDEAQQTKRLLITTGIERARSLESDDEFEAMIMIIRNTCLELGDTVTAVEVLNEGVQRAPNNYTLHYLLGLDLISVDRPAEAADHLQWCSARQPNDPHLRKLMSRAVTERLKQTPSTAFEESGRHTKRSRR